MPCRITDGDLAAVSAYLDCEGTKGAADRLGVAHSTLRARLTRIHSKVGVSTTAGVVYAVRHGLERYRESRWDRPRRAGAGVERTSGIERHPGAATPQMIRR
jgi:hypothetical protein